MDSTLATKSDINSVKIDVAELTLIKWMLGIVIAVEVMPLLKQFL